MLPNTADRRTHSGPAANNGSSGTKLYDFVILVTFRGGTLRRSEPFAARAGGVTDSTSVSGSDGWVGRRSFRLRCRIREGSMGAGAQDFRLTDEKWMLVGCRRWSLRHQRNPLAGLAMVDPIPTRAFTGPGQNAVGSRQLPYCGSGVRVRL